MTVTRRAIALRHDERGIAMVLSLLLVLTMSVLSASLMFLSQTETYSSLNYRLMSQARYGAEAGVNKAANYLLNTYVPPATAGTDPLSNYNPNVSPVTYNGSPVILSANSAVASNYPDAAVRTAFAAAVQGTLAAGSTNVTYAPYATLISMEQIPAAVALDGIDHTIQTWQITADGHITTGNRTARVEVDAVLETQKISTSSPSLNYATFATSHNCGAITFSGSARTDSYDSSALVGGNPVISNSHGNVGTNGNLTENGNATIYGSLSTPRVGVGNCSSGNVNAQTSSGHATVTGGIIHLPSAVILAPPNVPLPNLGSPPNTNITIGGGTTCASIGLSAENCSVSAGNMTITGNGSPLTLGNISVTGNLTIASGSYTLGDVSVSGSGTLALAGGAGTRVNMTSLTTAGNSVTTIGTGTYNTNDIHLTAGTPLSVISHNQVTLNVVRTFTMTGGSDLILPADTGSNPATVALNVVNTDGVASPIDFSGGTVANPSYDASRFQIQYGGAGNIKLSGGTQQAEVIYAPNAPVALTGTSDLYGAVIGLTVTDTGGAKIHYDRHLQNTGLFSQVRSQPGNPMLSSFTWKKF